MKNIFISILLILCSGCIPLYYLHDEHKKSLMYENISESTWEVLTLPANTWVHERRLSSRIPEYFSVNEMRRLAGYTYEYFFAKYEYGGEHPLALWIRQYGLRFRRSKVLNTLGESVPTPYDDTMSHCKNSNSYTINIATNTVDIDFDTVKVFLLNGDKKIPATELSSSLDYKKTVLKFETFNLADPKVTTLMQPHGIISKRLLSFPTFTFRFSPITCRELDNAVLVIDGFSHQGKPIPPLKVRINYAADYEIPEYVEGSKSLLF